MLMNKRRCGRKFLYVYSDRLKKKKEKHVLLKGRVVHRVMQLLLTNPQLHNQIKSLTLKVLDDYAGPGKGNTYERAHATYEFPTPNQKVAYFTWDDFLLQLVTSAEILWAYVKYMELKPISIDGTLQIERPVEYDVPSEGDFEDKKCKNILDLVAIDKNGEIAIYDWKLGMRKYVVKSGMSEADGNNNMVSYAIAMNDLAVDTFSPPVCVRIVRAVVTKKGKASTSTNHPITGLDLYERQVTGDDMQEEIANIRADLDDINNDRLRKNKTSDCVTMCDFAEACLKGEMKNYEVKPEYKPENPL
jgi:hypothetical protein